MWRLDCHQNHLRALVHISTMISVLRSSTFPRPSAKLVLALLAVVILIFFSPILSTYFLADDYNYVGHLLVNARYYVQGEQLAKWFVDFSAQGLQVPVLSVFFRPVVQWLWLTDFIMWGTGAFGYHLTNVILHTLNSFLIYLLALRVLHNRFGGIAAGLLFALHPIHPDSVAWIADRTDVLSAFFYFLSALFFVLYRQRGKLLFYALSVVAFALAIGTKENTVALPFVLLAYDLIFKTRPRLKIAKAQLGYWMVLGGYVTLRLIALGQFGRNTGGGFMSFGLGLFAHFYVQSLAQPFITDITQELFLVALSIAIVFLIVYRERRVVWFGVMWIVISLLPAASAAYVAPRLVYAPSAGLAFALAAAVAQPFSRQTNWARAFGAAVLAGFLIVYGWGVARRVDDWAAAGTVARAIPSETQRLVPTLASDSRLYYTGVPDLLRNIYIYNENFSSAIQIAYQVPTLQVYRVDKFPIVNDRLDRTYFLEYQRRKITARDDLIGVLLARKQCLAREAVGVAWDFFGGAVKWQLGNQLELVRERDGALLLRSLGDDPHLISPEIDLSALSLGDIEIEMSVRADMRNAQGVISWTGAGQTDFAPGQQKKFDIQPDGAFHLYRLNIVDDGVFAIDDRITRLKLEPVEAPAEIALKSVRVYQHCAQNAGANCKCP